MLKCASLCRTVSRRDWFTAAVRGSDWGRADCGIGHNTHTATHGYKRFSTHSLGSEVKISIMFTSILEFYITLFMVSPLCKDLFLHMDIQYIPYRSEGGQIKSENHQGSLKHCSPQHSGIYWRSLHFVRLYSSQINDILKWHSCKLHRSCIQWLNA